MRGMSAGVERSLLVGSIARMQIEDAADAASKRSGLIDWQPVKGCSLFQGPVSIPTEVCVEVELEVGPSAAAPAARSADVRRESDRAA